MYSLVLAALISLPATTARPTGPLAEPGVAARLAEAWPDVETAADLAGLPVEVLAALLVHESRLLPAEGAGCHGLAQISWSTWQKTLAGERLDLPDLYDPVWGVLAAGIVLSRLRGWLGGPTVPTWRLLCWYSDGSAALSYHTSCGFSVAVLELAQKIQRWGLGGDL